MQKRANKVFFQKLAKVVQAVSLAVITVSIVIVGAIVAPSVFKQLPVEQAAPVMAQIFAKLGALLKASLIIYVLALLVQQLSIDKTTTPVETDIDLRQEVRKKLLRASHWVGRFVFIILGALLVMELIPTMVDYANHLERLNANYQEFRTLHEQSRGLFQIEAGLGLLLLIILVL